MIFKEDHEAEIEVKKIMLDALEQRKRAIDPLITNISVEIEDLKRGIESLEKELEEESKNSI